MSGSRRRFYDAASAEGNYFAYPRARRAPGRRTLTRAVGDAAGLYMDDRTVYNPNQPSDESPHWRQWRPALKSRGS